VAQRSFLIDSSPGLPGNYQLRQFNAFNCIGTPFSDSLPSLCYCLNDEPTGFYFKIYAFGSSCTTTTTRTATTARTATTKPTTTVKQITTATITTLAALTATVKQTTTTATTSSAPLTTIKQTTTAKQTTITTTSPAPIFGDLNGDRLINSADLTIVQTSFGPCFGCIADIYVDGVVDILDVVTLIDHWKN
jgi:hypothetical protein